MCHYPQSRKTVFIRVNRCLKNEIGPFEPVPSSLCGCLDLCESALSAIPLRFAHLNIRVLSLFRISCFVFRISSSLYPLLSPSRRSTIVERALQIALFLQNKANFKMGNINISTVRTKAYANEQRTMNNERYPKQTQSNPIFLRPKPPQPPVHPVIPTEGTLPACRSGGICFNTLAASETACMAHFTKQSCPVLCKTNPIFATTKPTQPSLPQRFMKPNHARPTRKNKPNQTQFPSAIRNTRYEIRNTNAIPLYFFPPRQQDSWGILGERGGMLLQACAVPMRPIF